MNYFPLIMIGLFACSVAKLNANDNDERVKISVEYENLADDPNRINIAFTFTKANNNQNLIDKFKSCIRTLLKYATIDLNIFVLGDADSQLIARRLFDASSNVNNINYKVISLDTDMLAQRMHKLVSKMQKHFSHSPSSYYGDSLFFISIGLFKILDLRIKQIITLDVDIEFRNDVRYLHDHFGKFTSDNIIGIARDAQPVYRHLFWQYRNEHPGTRVGAPPPDGLTGFNSGVLLLNLDKIRQSSVYEGLLMDKSIDELTQKYHFKGHLGDQDFFTLIGMEHPELFYILPCTWNRQLCVWWRDKGYTDIFNDYYTCENNDAAKINLYHGNCNSKIPADEAIGKTEL